MLAVKIIQAVVFLTYVIYLVNRYGVLPSISDSFYITGEKSIFRLFCIAISLPMVFYNEVEFMLAAFGGILVGVADNYKAENLRAIKKAHFIGAAILIGMSLIGLGFTYLAIFVIGAIPLLFVNNRIWWIEILAFTIIITGLLV